MMLLLWQRVTMHDACLNPVTGRYAIAKANDTTKDQSYMLAQLTQDQLARLVLPLGEWQKTDVRVFADEHELPVAHRAEKSGSLFCFC